MPHISAGTASVISRTSQRRGGCVGRSPRRLIGYRSRLLSSTELLFVHHKQRVKHNHITAFITKRGGYIIAHLRKLEKAAMVAFMEMPMSANAKLNTRKLLGVLSSLTLRKATTVTAFRKKPNRPWGWRKTFVNGNALVCRSRCTRTHNAAGIEFRFIPRICKVGCFLFRSWGISHCGIAADDLVSVWQRVQPSQIQIGSIPSEETRTLTLHQQTRSQREHVEVGEALR